MSRRNTQSGSRIYTVFEVAEMLSISRTSAYNLVNAGTFKTVRIGSMIRISRKSFDEWLEQQLDK